MKLKDYFTLTAASLLLGAFLTRPIEPRPVIPSTTDSTQVKEDISEVNVDGKRALFIGDSHTANKTNGWQTQLSKAVGFKQINASEIGKTTYWMLNMAVYKLEGRFDYCFVYGGANDMYTTSITAQEAVNNIKGIAKICNKLGVKCIVLTGFDPVLCTRTPNKRYGYRYADFQRMLLTQYMEGATVVDTRVVDRRDCWDGLCHMNPEGHKKIAKAVIKQLRFKINTK